METGIRQRGRRERPSNGLREREREREREYWVEMVLGVG
jgi:hypothetical protein